MKDFFLDLPMQKSSMIIDEDEPRSPFPGIDDPQSPGGQDGGGVIVPASIESAIAMGIIDITKESIRCFTEYAKCKEYEETERKRISANLKVVQIQIEAQKEAYLKALEKNFEERNRLYDLAEKAQEKALENGDKDMLQLCYNFILNVYTRQIGEEERRMLLDSSSFLQH